MKKISILIAVYLGVLAFLISDKESPTQQKSSLTGEEIWQQQLAKKKARRENGYAKMNAPEVFQEFHKGIRTPEDLKSPSYPINHRMNQLREGRKKARMAKTKGTVLGFTSRGPANVPGRTRGLLVMQTDETSNTWLAGAAGGGIWKTTDAGKSWRNLTPNFPVLAVSTLANSDVNPNIIYAGTGEYIASAGTAIEGAGIFKSLDGGETWVQLPSTVGTPEFIAVTRIIVDPNNPDLVLSCSAPNVWDAPGDFLSTIMRSEDGGATWERVFEVFASDVQAGTKGPIEQLVATPGNFNVLYASSHAVGVYKSLDAGKTWFLASTDMNPSGRIELAVSPVDVNRLFASVQGSLAGTESDLYVSDDAGESWDLVNVAIGNTPLDFLGGQGWYDNTVAADPHNRNIVYFGGVSLFRTKLGSGSEVIDTYSLINETSFVDFVNFSAEFAGGKLDVGLFASEINVEIRFGAGMTQKAHRYVVPEDATSGVQPEDYFYEDYVDVPFEVWDVTNNRQLAVAFRDQDRNGQFNLKQEDTTGPAIEQSREYIYIPDITYTPNAPVAEMAENGGHEALNMYFFWPILAQGFDWDPTNLEGTIRINYAGIEKINATSQAVVDVYGEYDGINQFETMGDDVHPDQHNMIMITDPASLEYRILLSNDGGVFYSNKAREPGINEGDWTFAGLGYITSQFYGADRSPVEERYFGGMQDNGTWLSPIGLDASETTRYRFAIGGDGFEVIWHNLDPLKLIGGSQYNNFRRSLDGGVTWVNASEGITGNEPFISKLSNSPFLPDRIFTVTSAGVFISEDFGGSWELTPIDTDWIGNASPTFLDVEVSRANANIVWAGSGMGTSRRLHVSTDGGQTFQPVNNYDLRTMGNISHLASHPSEDSTAYALFAFAKRPKILRTTDLGQTWEDISGYETQDFSSNDFPDVAVYSLYVRPDNTDIIWAGTEIGIVESTDNGQSWHLLDDFIHASIWDFKGVENEIVLATHGRGIWTAEVSEDQHFYEAPAIDEVARTPEGNIAIALSYETDVDSTALLINDAYVGSITTDTNPQDTIIISGLDETEFDLQVIGYRNASPLANLLKATVIPASDPLASFSTQFTTPDDIAIIDFRLRSVNSGTKDVSINSPHPYTVNEDLMFKVIPPIIISADNPILSYDDIAIVQPGADNDFVVVEATADGLNWIPIVGPYDAGFSQEWLDLFNANDNPTGENFIRHSVNLTDFFNPGQKILVRFRLHSDEDVVGFGWTIDDLFIQTEVVGTEKELADEFVMYPNPASDHLNISLPNENVKLTVVDIAGRKMVEKEVSQKSIRLNTSKFKNGTYVLVIEGNGKKEVKKFIIQH